ncbi:MAG: DUF4350 domain-containing protein [Verrucomicrobia bacterium]|nr:DUF4350 domain-containing protein [Verrucomicrobiota bacterium]
MRNDRLIAFILIGLVTAIFVVVGVQMFKVRAEVNGVYPEYSSFRADPKGYRILFDTLSRLGSIHVERFEQVLTELPPGAGKILVVAGVPPSGLLTDQIKPLDDWMTKGGTVLVAFTSLGAFGLPAEHNADQDQRDPPQHENKPLRDEVGKFESWGIRILWSKQSLVNQLQSNLFPDQFSWAGHLYIQPTKSDWGVLAKARDLPVVLQRNFGTGKLVVLADSYPLSNIALAAHRNAALVSWLFPQHSTVLLDESHFGIVEHPGVIGLARRYGLDGAIVAILCLAVLYLWASRYSLRPVRRQRADSEPAVRGIGGNEIFTNLLRRTLPATDLCAICLQIWKQKGPTNPIKQARLESLLNSLPTTTSQVERYNQIVKLQHS